MNNNWKELCDIMTQLEQAKGKAKEKILRQNKDNELLRKVLLYTYDRNKKFGLSRRSIVFRLEPSKWTDVFEMLDELAVSNINNDLKIHVGRFLGNISEVEIAELIIKIILKDLKVGISIKTINKAMDNLIYDFQVMKASAYDDKNKITFNTKASKVGYTMMIKWNGIRGEIIKENDTIVVKSRQDKIVNGFGELNEAMKGLPNDYLYEGELLAVGDFKESKEQFKLTDKIYSTDGDKKGLMIKIFDCIPLEDFGVGEWNVKLNERKRMLKEWITENNNPLVQFADVIYEGKDTTLIEPTLDKVSENGLHEGLMVALNDGKYEAKRVKSILKCKLWQTMDLQVIGLKESNERPNTLGSLILDFKGREQGCSGIGEELKELWWNDSTTIVGKIIECKFKEITNDKDGNEGLQFCNFIRVRDDKTIEDISYE